LRQHGPRRRYQQRHSSEKADQFARHGSTSLGQSDPGSVPENRPISHYLAKPLISSAFQCLLPLRQASRPQPARPSRRRRPLSSGPPPAPSAALPSPSAASPSLPAGP